MAASDKFDRRPSIWVGNPELDWIEGHLFVLTHDNDQEFVIPRFYKGHFKLGCTKVTYKAARNLFWRIILNKLGKVFYVTD
jgi:hypothetical protein